MKLVRKNKKEVVFRLTRKEKASLIALLHLYPVMPAAYHHSVSGESRDELEKTQRLLEEALYEQIQENKAELLKFLQTPDRFRESEENVLLQISLRETDWFLQVLNDIRVGSWIKAGSPSPRQPLTDLDEAKLRALWAMETTGLFQHALLSALKGEE